MIHMLRVENWGPFETLTIDFSNPLTIFVGPNGVGKSYCRDAITFALTGTLRTRRQVMKKNQIPEVAIREGAKSAEVELLFKGGMRITRRLTASGQTLELRDPNEGGINETPVAGTQGELQAELYRRLGVDEGRALAALDGRRFLELEPDARKALLFAAVGAGVTAESIAKALEHQGVDDALARSVATLAGNAGFRKAADHAVEHRRIAKRKLDTLGEDVFPEQIIQGERPIDLATVSIDAISKQIAGLEAEVTTLAKQSGATVATARRSAELFAEQLTQARGELGDIDDGDNPEQVFDSQAAAKNIDAQRAAIEAAEAKLKTAREAIAAARAIVNARLGALDLHCPATTCPVKSDHAERSADLAAKRADAEKRLADFLPEEKRLSALVAGYLGTIEELTAQRARAEANDKLRSRLVDRIADLEQKVENAERVAGELEGAGLESPEREQKVIDLRARLERGRDLLVKKRAFDGAAERRNKSAESRAAAQKDSERWDQIAGLLEPGGIEADLVREVLVPIRERLTLTGKILGAVELTDELEVLTRIDGHVRSEPQLSEGQWHALGLVMQDAIASLTNFPVLLFDEAEMLVQEMRSRALGTLQKLCDAPYGSVLVFGASNEPVPQKPTGVGVVWVKSPGVAEVL